MHASSLCGTRVSRKHLTIYPAFVGRADRYYPVRARISASASLPVGGSASSLINDNIRSFKHSAQPRVRNQLDEEIGASELVNLLQIADAVGIEIK
jgi:hypothetical protein